MLEFVHDFLDFILSVNFNFEIVSRVGQICRYDEEPLVDLVQGDGDFELLVGSLAILLVFAHWDRHLPHMVRFVRKFDIRGRSLLRATWTALLSLLVLLLLRRL